MGLSEASVFVNRSLAVHWVYLLEKAGYVVLIRSDSLGGRGSTSAGEMTIPLFGVVQKRVTPPSIADPVPLHGFDEALRHLGKRRDLCLVGIDPISEADPSEALYAVTVTGRDRYQIILLFVMSGGKLFKEFFAQDIKEFLAFEAYQGDRARLPDLRDRLIASEITIQIAECDRTQSGEFMNCRGRLVSGSLFVPFETGPSLSPPDTCYFAIWPPPRSKPSDITRLYCERLSAIAASVGFSRYAIQES